MVLMVEMVIQEYKEFLVSQASKVKGVTEDFLDQEEH